jgi:hypothetical protein
MLQKNIDKEKRKSRPTWVGYAPKKTPTKKEKMKKIDRKHKGRKEY